MIDVIVTLPQRYHGLASSPRQP